MIRLFFAFLFFVLAGLTVSAQKLRIAVASNAQFVSEALKETFEKETGIELELVVNSSGKLTAQIEQGMLFDVFLSADMKYPEMLYKKGLAEARPKIYAYGSLVLWTLEDIELSNEISILTEATIRKIAVANPQMAPYGETAIKALNNYNIYRPVQDKLVYGESITDVNQFVISGAVEAGFTAKSVVMAPAMKEKGKWIELDPKLCPPIPQGVIILKAIRKHNYQNAYKFYNFLFSKMAQTIFNQYGYTNPGSQPKNP